MVDLSLRQRSSPHSWRCPWCHEGERPGESWQLCPRDQAPIHEACLAEYRVCPLCREDLPREPRASLAAALPASSSIDPIEVSIDEWRRILQGPLGSPVLPELDESARALLSDIRWDSFSPSFWIFLLIFSYGTWIFVEAFWSSDPPISIGLALGYLAALRLLLWNFTRPRTELWLDESAPEARQELAERLVLGDRRALAAWKSWRRAQRRFEKSIRALRALQAQGFGPSPSHPLLDFVDEAKWVQSAELVRVEATLLRLRALKRAIYEAHQVAELAAEVLALWALERPSLRKELLEED